MPSTSSSTSKIYSPMLKSTKSRDCHLCYLKTNSASTSSLRITGACELIIEIIYIKLSKFELCTVEKLTHPQLLWDRWQPCPKLINLSTCNSSSLALCRQVDASLRLPALMRITFRTKPFTRGLVLPNVILQKVRSCCPERRLLMINAHSCSRDILCLVWSVEVRRVTK
jgi:hypothetical protein